MTIDQIKALSPQARFDLLKEQVAIRYPEGGIKAFAADFGVAVSGWYRWRDTPKSLPLAIVVAIVMLNEDDAEVRRLREETILDQLTLAHENLAALSASLAEIAKRAVLVRRQERKKA